MRTTNERTDVLVAWAFLKEKAESNGTEGDIPADWDEWARHRNQAVWERGGAVLNSAAIASKATRDWESWSVLPHYTPGTGGQPGKSVR
jgi:hypothetical protein